MEVGRKKKQPKRLFPSTVPTNIPLGVKPEEFPQIYPQGSNQKSFHKYTLRGQTRRVSTNLPSLRGRGAKNVKLSGRLFKNLRIFCSKIRPVFAYARKFK